MGKFEFAETEFWKKWWKEYFRLRGPSLAAADLFNANSFGDDVLHSVLWWFLYQVAVQQAGKVTVQALGNTFTCWAWECCDNMFYQTEWSPWQLWPFLRLHKKQELDREQRMSPLMYHSAVTLELVACNNCEGQTILHKRNYKMWGPVRLGNHLTSSLLISSLE